KRYKPFFTLYLFFSIWFVVGIGLYTQIFPIDGTVADRWFYFPIVGLLGMVGVLYESVVRKILRNISGYKIVTIALAVAIISLLSIRTIVRNTNWENAIVLYSHDIHVSDNVDLENNLGNEYLQTGKYAKALSHLNKAIDPYSLEFNLQNIGATYAKMGNLNEAKLYYEKSFTVNNHNLYFPHKHDSSSYINYAQVLILEKNPRVALNFIQNALRDYPDSSALWMDLALVEYKNHQTKEAIAAIAKAFQINPYAQYATIYDHIMRNEPISISLGGKTFVFSSN
ncbi:MAG: tetratricopeptide repeat protein, partial [Patescibacteria group bacterium]|nr:tetratricopeptide repeat protein [Patescibacteria group bacterium]